MKVTSDKHWPLGILVALTKGFSVFYFVLLPVFYSKQVIDLASVGYVGALFIGMLILGTLLVITWLHEIRTVQLLRIGAWFGLLATLILMISIDQASKSMLLLAYGLMGLVSGVALSSVNALIASGTEKGNRFKSIAQISMFTDLGRIAFPLAIAGILSVGTVFMAVSLVGIISLIFLVITYSIRDSERVAKDEGESIAKGLRLVAKNKLFRFVLSLEFLDSFSSSQLFVFLPLLFLEKGYTLERSLLLQTFVFLGYISGRWIVGVVASKYSGNKAIAAAEFGMVATIGLLLLSNNIVVLYILTFSLGVFSRGTSPAIKALSFDSLSGAQTKQGVALHVLAGDTGSVLAQLTFGLLLTTFSVIAPFVVAGAIGILVAGLCLTYLTKHKTMQ